MAGNLLITDEGVAGHWAVISSVDGSTISTPIIAATCERGDFLPASGIFCIGAAIPPNSTDVPSFKLFDKTLNEIANVTTPVITTHVASFGCGVRAARGSNTFYVIGQNHIIYTISSAGVVGGTSWTLPLMGGFTPTALGVSQDETVAFFTRGNINNVALKRWDLVNNVALPDFIAAQATTRFNYDFLTTSGGKLILVASPDGGSTFILKVYDIALGTLTTSLSLGAAEDGGSDIELNTDLVDPEGHFWVRTFPDASELTSTFTRYKVSDLSVATTFVVNNDVSVGGSGVVPFSCPTLMLLVSATGTITVNKATDPSGALQSFAFSAGGGLSPSSFSLVDGGSQIFSGLSAGTYSITETPVSNWDVVYSVSNSSPHTAITVADGESVVVTITNNQIIKPGSGIYKITPGKRNDTLWVNTGTGSTEVVKIPDPFAKTGYIG